jgi:RNA ligase
MTAPIDIDLLRSHIAAGIVREQKHSSLPLSIFNYSERCQYERLWDNVTLQSRGLVMHGDRVVARPFRKFFNDTEHAPDEIPWHLPYQVAEKMDGSLLIVFHFDGEWRFATRGSFESEQAGRGREIFRRRYGATPLNPDVTYLFEVIYPQNRIVVNYGAREDIILLAMIDTQSGVERDPASGVELGLSVVRHLPPDADAKALRSIIRDDEEGYVVRFANGFRVKVKGQRYMELHRIITGVSTRTVWEYLSENKSFDEMLAVVPDEFAQWVRMETEAQNAAHKALQRRAEAAYLAVKHLPDRKSQALAILANYCDISAAAFALLDGKSIDSILWKDLYPAFRRPEVLARIDA